MSSPTNTALPIITGTAQVGQTLTASDGTWTGDPTFEYQWKRCEFGSNILWSGVSSSLFEIAIHPSGNFYVASASNPAMRVIDPSGNLIYSWGTYGSGDGQIPIATGFDFDSEGNVYVADYLNHRIQVFSPDGTFLRKWGSNGTGDGQLKSPKDIAIDSEDNVYVADTNNFRIQVFDSNGTYLRQWNAYGPDNFGITGIHLDFDENDNLYVADHLRTRVQIYETDGTFVDQWISSEIYAASFGITFHNNSVYIPSSSVIKVFDTEGTLLESLQEAPGYQPADVAIGSDGTFYFLEKEINGWAIRIRALGTFCENIEEATSSTFEPTNTELGKTIKVVVTATNEDGSTSATSENTSSVIAAFEAPTNTSPPELSGSGKVGETLTISDGVWGGNPEPEISYQWLSSDSASGEYDEIAGATADSYLPTINISGKYLIARVTATNSEGTSSIDSDPVRIGMPGLVHWKSYRSY